MNEDRTTPEERLLDLHLDRLDDEQRVLVETELQQDAAMQEKSQRLGRILKPLDYWQPAAATDRLADRILDTIRGQQLPGIIKMQPESIDAYRPRFLQFRDLAAVAACVLLLVGVFVPGLSAVRSRSQRAACANNLGSIFRGTSIYQEVFAGSLPFAGQAPNAMWLPSSDSSRPFASNSRHSYLLVKGGYGPTAKNFICPSDDTAVPMVVDDFTTRKDFTRAANISYDALNLCSGGGPGDASKLRPRKSLVYMGDSNPLFTNAKFNPAVNADVTNSLAHGRGGQTLLTLDGAARWAKSPLVGPNQDNIWLAGTIRNYTGSESRSGTNDVQLIPGLPTGDVAAHDAAAHDVGAGNPGVE